MTEELGLHFEGRSRIGLHRHTPMAMMAYAFLQSRRLAATGRKEESLDAILAAGADDASYLREVRIMTREVKIYVFARAIS